MAGKRAAQSLRSWDRAPPSSEQRGAARPQRPRDPFVGLYQTHFPAPRLRTDSVRRAGRIGRLGDLDARVVVVSAPPGYGKTTLVAEWADEDERPFLYVSLKHREDPAAVLLAALTRIAAVTEARGEPELAVARPEADSDSLTHIGAALARCALPLVLAIDDAQLVASDHGTAIVDTLVDHLPDSSQLVLATHGRGRLIVIGTATRACCSTSAVTIGTVRRPDFSRSTARVLGMTCATSTP